MTKEKIDHLHLHHPPFYFLFGPLVSSEFIFYVHPSTRIQAHNFISIIQFYIPNAIKMHIIDFFFPAKLSQMLYIFTVFLRYYLPTVTVHSFKGNDCFLGCSQSCATITTIHFRKCYHSKKELHTN